MEVGRRSPAKPWERARGGVASTPTISSLPLPRRAVGGINGTLPTSTVSAPVLPVPPRAGRGSVSSYGGGGMMDRYGGNSYGGYGTSSYGSSYGSYGGYNSYGRAGYGGGMMSRYGGGYGSSGYGGYGNGYGSGYGSGYGGYGGMDRFGGGGYGGYQKPEGLGFVRDFQVLADGFARFSRLLDANFDAMYGSLTSVSMLFEHLHNLRREIFFAFQAISLVGVLRKVWTTWFGASSVPTLLEASSSFPLEKTLPQLSSSQFDKKQAGSRSRPLRALGLLFLIISAPFILAKLARMVMGIPPNVSLLGDGRSKVLAIHDFQGETPEEITFRKGTVMFVLGKPFEGWLEIETTTGERGLIPENYVRPLEGETVAEPQVDLPRETLLANASSDLIYDYGEQEPEMMQADAE